MSDYQNNNQPPQNILSEYKLKLIGEKQNGGSKNPTLQMGVYKNNPRIVVRTGIDGDKEYGRITAELDVMTFYAVIDLIKRVVDNQGECRYVMENKNFIFPGGKRSDKPVVKTTTIIGKEEDGRIYIAVTAKERPKIKFYFKSPYFHDILGPDGIKISDADDSAIYAKAFCRQYEAIMPHVLISEFKPWTPGGNGGNGGGGQSRQNQGGGYTKNNNTDFDEDFPYNG